MRACAESKDFDGFEGGLDGTSVAAGTVPKGQVTFVYVRAGLLVCVRVRACVRACVCARARACVCLCVCVCVCVSHDINENRSCFWASMGYE